MTRLEEQVETYDEQLRERAATIDRLTAVVDRLPETRDSVPLITLDGEPLAAVMDDGFVLLTSPYNLSSHAVVANHPEYGEQVVHPHECFSTMAAAHEAITAARTAGATGEKGDGDEDS